MPEFRFRVSLSQVLTITVTAWDRDRAEEDARYWGWHQDEAIRRAVEIEDEQTTGVEVEAIPEPLPEHQRETRIPSGPLPDWLEEIVKDVASAPVEEPETSYGLDPFNLPALPAIRPPLMSPSFKTPTSMEDVEKIRDQLEYDWLILKQWQRYFAAGNPPPGPTR